MVYSAAFEGYGQNLFNSTSKYNANIVVNLNDKRTGKISPLLYTWKERFFWNIHPFVLVSLNAVKGENFVIMLSWGLNYSQWIRRNSGIQLTRRLLWDSILTFIMQSVLTPVVRLHLISAWGLSVDGSDYLWQFVPQHLN